MEEIKVLNILLFSSSQYLSFLFYCSNDLDAAAKRLENYFIQKRDAPEFYKNRDLLGKAVQSQMGIIYFVMLPPLTETTGLVYMRLSNCDPSKYDPNDASKVLSLFIGKS